MSSVLPVDELFDGVFAEHHKYGTVQFIGYLESYAGTLCVIQDEDNLLHLVFKCDLTNYWCWGD